MKFKRRPVRIPHEAQRLLRQVPTAFISDGCSRSPDRWFGFDFRWCCLLHDWGYCSRAHRFGLMGPSHKHAVDLLLSEHMHAALPLRWRWLGHIYRRAVHWFAWGSYDTCHGVKGRCRHGLARVLYPDTTP